jgi:CxxC motif-containing protein
LPETRKFVCIGCPVGCPLQLVYEGGEILETSGHECDRGAKYARQEFSEPRRSLTSTVAISGARWERLPVKVAGLVHKDRVREAAAALRGVHAEAPVRCGQVLREGLLGDLTVVATRSMDRAS